MRASPISTTPALDTLTHTREHLAKHFWEDLDASAYLKNHAQALDTFILEAWKPLSDSQLALIAVGGYGREELFAHSDIDITIIVPPETDVPEDKLASFIQTLWQTGLSVGASVRTPEELLNDALDDVTFATSLVDARFLAGSHELATQTLAQFWHQLDAKTFFRDKALERDRRHQRFDDTPYSLEPNLKESPGGLRDIHLFEWCHKVLGMKQLPQETLTTQERLELTRTHKTLLTLRLGLHLLAHRHEDRLLFDYQTELAQRLGFVGDSTSRPSEALMKRVYLNAKRVLQCVQIQLDLMQEILEVGKTTPAVPIESDPLFLKRTDVLDCEDLDTFNADPTAWVRAFYHVVHCLDLNRFSTRLMRAIWAITSQYSQTPQDVLSTTGTFQPAKRYPLTEEHAYWCRRLLESGHASEALRRLNNWGAMSCLIPELAHTIGMMQHDLYHIFTVDQHTLRAVEFVEHYVDSAYAHEFSELSTLASQLSQPVSLIYSALFHDIGKGLGGDHARVGETLFRGFASRVGLESSLTELVAFAIREHLTMSHTAQKEDISQDEVIAQFKEKVGTLEHLNLLYLLTVADIRATSPKVWTPWKAQLLKSLYVRTRQEFHKTQTMDPDALWHEYATHPRFEALAQELDVVYGMRHSADVMAWHADTITPGVPTLGARAVGDDLFEVVLYTPDAPGLFRHWVSIWTQWGLNILQAKIHTTKRGFALDTFTLLDTHQRFTLEALTAKLDKVGPTPERGPYTVPALGRLSRRSRHFPVPTQVRLVQDAHHQSSLLSLVTTDRAGLLAVIADVFENFGLSIQSAFITTLGERVEDVFRLDGTLPDDHSVIELEKTLLNRLQT